MKKSQVWGSHLSDSPDDKFVKFCSGRDVESLSMADYELIPYDILTNLAHIDGLHKINVLDSTEHQQIKAGLLQIHSLHEKQQFHLLPDKEDVHFNIEYFLTNHLKITAAEKIHTGRSRNDQVTTDIRLYSRQKALQFGMEIINLAKTIADFASKHIDTIVPGFTHGQPAMPTTIAHWVSSWAFSLIRDADFLFSDIIRFNLSPLGSAASFGTSWNPDREYVSQLLGFTEPQENTLDCITNKSEYETRLASTISHASVHFNTICQDVYWLSHPYFQFLKLPDKFVSGSSIMPHKKNPDFAEIIRGKTSLCHGYTSALWGIEKSSISGYNRDLQSTKYLIMDIFREISPIPSILSSIIKAIEIDIVKCEEKSMEHFIYSADLADFISRKYKISFRKSYNITAVIVKYSTQGIINLPAAEKAFHELLPGSKIDDELMNIVNNPKSLLQTKTHTGAPSPESVTKSLNKLNADISKLREKYIDLNNKIDQCLSNLLSS